MPLINLKFSPEMEELVLQGKKCCTTRDEPKGKVRDVFRVKDRLYRIIQIQSYDVSSIAHLYKLEGFGFRHQFLKAIEEIYPDIYDCCDNVLYAHFFAYVGDWCPQFGIEGSMCNEEVCELYSDCVEARESNGS